VEALYLAGDFIKQVDIPIATIKEILACCQVFPSHREALWCLIQLIPHLPGDVVMEEVCAASEAVTAPLIARADPSMAGRQGQIDTLVSLLVEVSNRSDQLRSRTDALLLTWLRNPASFGGDPKSSVGLQQPVIVQRLMELIVSGALDIVEDRAALERFLRWVNGWESSGKSQLYSVLDFLKKNYPAPGLWDIVEIETHPG
jgi:hypothetical protein